MNKYFYTTQSTKRSLKMIHGKVAIGSSGAPTLNAAASSGVLSISRTSAGLYAVTLAGQAPGFVGFQCTVLDSNTTSITHFQVTAEALSTAGTFSFLCLAPQDSSTTTATATDPASGAVLYFTVLFSNSSLDQ